MSVGDSPGASDMPLTPPPTSHPVHPSSSQSTSVSLPPGSAGSSVCPASRLRRHTHASPLSSNPAMLLDSIVQAEPRTAPMYEGIPCGPVNVIGDGSYPEVASSSMNLHLVSSHSANGPSTHSPVLNGHAAKTPPRRSRTVRLELGAEPLNIIGPLPSGQVPHLSEKARGKRPAVPSVDDEHASSRKRQRTSGGQIGQPTPLLTRSTPPTAPLGRDDLSGEMPRVDIPKLSLTSIRSGPARSKKVTVLDENGVPLPEPTGIRPSKLKKGVRASPWRSVRPSASTFSAESTRPAAPYSPRIWCSSYEDLEAAAPVYKRSGFWNGVHRGMLDVPTLLFLDANGKQSDLGLHAGDCWSGRQLNFTMCYEYRAVLTSVNPDHSSLQIKEEVIDTAFPTDPPPRLSCPGVQLHAPQTKPSTSGSSYSSLDMVSDAHLDLPLAAALERDSRSIIKIPSTPASSSLSVHKAPLRTGNLPLSHSTSSALNSVPGSEADITKRLDDFCLDMSESLSDLSPLTDTSTLDSPAICPVPLAVDGLSAVGAFAFENGPVASAEPLSPSIIEHPPPPPEVQTLLDAHVRKSPVAPLVSRSSPVMPWLLQDEVGFVWAGLFTIENVEETTETADSPSSTVLRSWAFRLRWIPGGEFLLRDEDGDGGAYDAWLKTVERPWWETPTGLDQPPIPKGEAELYAELVPSLIPDGLLASFNTILLGESNFPYGFYCRTCGRVNVQTSLVRQNCGSTSCSVSDAVTRSKSAAAEWVPARSCILAMADSTWVPAITTRVTKLNGMSTRTYNVPNGADVYLPPPEGIALHMVATHIFTSNMFKHQKAPLESFTKIQRCIPFQRSKSEFAFLASTTFPPGDDNSKGRAYELGAFEDAADLIRDRVAEYGDGIGTLKIKKLSIKTWIQMKESRAKEDLPRVPTGGIVAILCLGANTQVAYTPQAMKAAMKKDKRLQTAARKEALRVVMIHGDVLVLSGAAVEAGLQLGLLRTGTTMFVVAECSRVT